MTGMTDVELIGYCEIHCETPVALFSPQHTNRMLELAGFPVNFVRSTDRWLSLHEEMKELCALARQRLAAPVAADAGR